MMRGRKRWVVTDKMFEALKEAAEKGETIASVARRLNISYGALVYWVKPLGLNFKRGGPRGVKRSPDICKRISEAKRGMSYLERRASLLNDYLQNKDQEWKALGGKHGFKEAETRSIVGHHLMAACRADDKCPLKPLLPEYKGEDEEK